MHSKWIPILGISAALLAGCDNRERTEAEYSERIGGAGTAEMPGAAGTAGTGAALSMDSRQFLEHAASGSMAEVRLGQMAQERASNPQVKQFGERMVRDHSQASDQLRRVAGQIGVQLPGEIDREHQQLMDRLATLHGPEFDREYMEAMVEDHQKEVQQFERRASQAENPQVRQFAEQTLPTLREHLEQAQQIQGQVR